MLVAACGTPGKCLYLAALWWNRHAPGAPGCAAREVEGSGRLVLALSAHHGVQIR